MPDLMPHLMLDKSRAETDEFRRDGC
jgi:hypothetical protein